MESESVKVLTGAQRGVSIPFKRESSWKAKASRFLQERNEEFQFPSNGKVHGKGIRDTAMVNPVPPEVSIPFKPESSWKVQ